MGANEYYSSDNQNPISMAVIHLAEEVFQTTFNCLEFNVFF